MKLKNDAVRRKAGKIVITEMAISFSAVNHYLTSVKEVSCRLSQFFRWRQNINKLKNSELFFKSQKCLSYQDEEAEVVQ